MDPVMYIASSQLDGAALHRTDAIEDFYQTHGHLPVWSRFADVVAAARSRLRAMHKAMSARAPGDGSVPTRMVR